MDAVRRILTDFVELGFVEISNGQVVQNILPIFNLYTYNATSQLFPYRWDLTVNYLRDYSRNHLDFEGYYFLSVYDGWREYSQPVDPADRQYIPWEAIPEEEKSSHFTFGTVGEPRFIVNPANVSLYIELPYPILSFNRHIGDTGVLLIPDTQFLEHGFEPYKDHVDMFDIPYSEKMSFMIWRGASNVNHGYNYVAQPLSDLIFETKAHPRTMAESISVAGDRTSPQISSIYSASFDYVPLESLLQYKYQLDIDGMVSAWSGFFWKLYSNSAVIKGPTHWEQWYYRDLVPFEHYIPLKSFHPRDIYAVYEWCETNSDRCEEIGRRGSEYVRKLTYRYAVEEYVIH